jgi:transposase
MKSDKAKRTPVQPVETKTEVLRRYRALHPRPQVVQDGAFRQGEFFDPCDLVQVRYEMLRRHEVEGQPVTAVADAFGVSRQAFYMTQAAFVRMGVTGLLPRQPGPKRAYKCTGTILDFVEQHAYLPPKDVASAIQSRFGVSINPRSVQRALARRKGKQ